MDLSLILQQTVVPMLVIFATQFVKKANSIPISSGQVARIRTFVGILTFVLTAVSAWLSGDLQSVLSPDILKVGIETAISFVIAHFGYHGISAAANK